MALIWDQLKLFLQNFTSRFLQTNSTTTPVEALWDQISDACLKAMQKHVPSKLTSNNFSQPWVNRQIKKLSRRKEKAYCKAKQTGSHTDWARFKFLKKSSQIQCRTAYNAYISSIICDNTSGKHKRFYHYIKSKRKDNTGIAALSFEGNLVGDSEAKATILNNQFTSVFSPAEGPNLPDLGPSHHPSIPDIVITEPGIRKLLEGLKPHKATGPDNIPSRLLIEAAEELSPAFVLFFQATLDQGVLPQAWKNAFVSPIFKKGKRSDPSNYRPISLTSIACKILEHVIHSNILRHLEKFNILSNFQHGFRKKRSCESQLLLTIHDLASGLNNRSQIDAVLLDFSKAFDKVPHQRLLKKLHHYGIRGMILDWIKAFLLSRKQQVILEGVKSCASDVSSGVPQGTVLGPLLFNIFINDLPNQVSSQVRLFADDCLIYREISDLDDSRALQNDLNCLQDWETNWMMSFNPDKCESIRITKKTSSIIDTTYKIHDSNIKIVNDAKYLGVTINSKLNWSSHINNITKKAHGTRAFLQRNLRNAPRAVKEHAYQTFVRPSVEFCSTVWSPHTIKLKDKLESVQRKAARFVFNDFSRASSVSNMLERLSWPTLELRRNHAKLSMVYKSKNDLISIPFEPPYFTRPPHSRTRGHSCKLLTHASRIDAYKFSFFPSIVEAWNGLSEDVVCSASIDIFRSGLPYPAIFDHR